MLATSHALAAGIILKTIPDPRISFPLAFLSHFALDLVPHWDFTSGINQNNNNHDRPSSLVGNEKRPLLMFLAAGDVLFGWGLAFWLFRNLDPTLLFLTIILAQLPDWLETPYYFLGLNLSPSIWMKKVQSQIHSRIPFPQGFLTQLLIILPLLLIFT